jgi:hypothetical protein
VLTLLSLSQAVSDIDRTHIDEGLDAVRSRVHEDVLRLDPERRIALIGAFVRGMRRLDVNASLAAERKLLTAAKLSPPPAANFSLDTAIGLLSVRGHLRWILLDAGLSWHQMQSVLAVVGTVCRAAIDAHSSLDIRCDHGQCTLVLRCRPEVSARMKDERALLREVAVERERQDGFEFTINKVKR